MTESKYSACTARNDKMEKNGLSYKDRLVFKPGRKLHAQAESALLRKSATFGKTRLSGSSCNTIGFELNGVDS